MAAPREPRLTPAQMPVRAPGAASISNPAGMPLYLAYLQQIRPSGDTGTHPFVGQHSSHNPLPSPRSRLPAPPPTGHSAHPAGAPPCADGPRPSGRQKPVTTRSARPLDRSAPFLSEFQHSPSGLGRPSCLAQPLPHRQQHEMRATPAPFNLGGRAVRSLLPALRRAAQEGSRRRIDPAGGGRHRRGRSLIKSEGLRIILHARGSPQEAVVFGAELGSIQV